MHRLVTFRRQVDDRQPPMSERYAIGRISPHTTVIGTALAQRISHGTRESGHGLPRHDTATLQESCEAAHEGVSTRLLRCGRPRAEVRGRE